MEDGVYGIPHRTFVEVERGNSNVTLNTLLKIALKFGIKPKDLFDI